MTSRPRTQEKTTEQTGFGFRWFQLDADLDEEGSALAYHVLFNTTTESWQPHSQAAASRIRIYSPAVGFTASDGDIVPCYFNPIGRRWEIFAPPGGGMHIARVPTGGIPARVGLTPGVVTVDVFKLDAAGDIEDALFDQEINNIYPLSVAYNSAAPYFQIHKNPDGKWFNEAPQASQVVGVPFVNYSGESIPPSGIMDVIGDVTIAGTPHLKAYKPGLSIRRRWLVNNTTFVNPGDTSLGSWLDDISGFAAVDAGSITSVAPGPGFGPRPGSWYLFPNFYGFTCEGSTLFFNGSWVAHFRQHEVNHLKVLLTDNLVQNTFVMARHIYRNTAGLMVASPFTNRFAVSDGGYLRNGEFITASDSQPIVADVAWLGGFWELTNAQCAPEAAAAGGGGYTPGGGQAAGQFAINYPPSPSSVSLSSL